MPGTEPGIKQRPILLDSAMGTRLIARGLDLCADDPSAWCLDRPEVVHDLHRADVLAGSDAILTNTFNANRLWLARTGRADRAAAINRAAVGLARHVARAGRAVDVFASIGPTAADDPAALIEQAEALLEAGVDALVLETYRHDQAIRALATLRPITPGPILVSLHAWPAPPLDAARRLADLGADGLGANCCVVDLDLVRSLRAATPLPTWLKPSAGLPGEALRSPDDFAANLAPLMIPGVAWVGGCCGTTPGHVGALRRAIDGVD